MLSISKLCGKGSIRLGSTAVLFCWAALMPTLLHADSASDSSQANTSEAAKQSAIQSLPLDKLDAQSREKVRYVITNITMFRRLPVRVIDCDPDLYLFAVRHPDVIVNTWRALKISQLQLQEIGPDKYRMKEVSGTTADLEILYKGHDTHILYAEGDYQGVLFKQTVKGRSLFVLKTGYIRETDNRYYITSRLDALLSIDPGAVELVTKTIQPIIGKIADNNFNQTLSFVGSLSRTIELNSLGVQRLAMQLPDVQPEVRNEFASLADTIAHKPNAVALRRLIEIKESEMANRNDEIKRR
jgi:hypothetical protein